MLAEDVRELLRAHCYGGQARRQEVRPPGPQEPQIEYDGRWWYGACCRELGTGPVIHDDSAEFLGYAPGWYRVSVWIPARWDHLGLIPFRGADGRWSWPCEPGTEHEGWVSAAELHLVSEGLIRMGREPWPFLVHERLLLTLGMKPLDAWCAGLLREGTAEAREELVDTIGKMASRAEQYHVRDVFGAPELHVDKEGVERVYFDGSRWFARIAVPLNAWTEGHLHPELSAQVWARGRVRMARALLRVPAETVLSVAGDAVVLTRDPHWTDDGKVGTLRRKR